jgi:hypothetical protein
VIVVIFLFVIFILFFFFLGAILANMAVGLHFCMFDNNTAAENGKDIHLLNSTTCMLLDLLLLSY